MREGITPSEDIKTLVEFYKDNVTYQRHHEDIRFKSSQLIVAIVGALVAATKFAGLGDANYVIAALIILLGMLGIAQVLKHTERADRHAKIARAYRRKIGEISAVNGATSVEEVHRLAARDHKLEAGLACKVRARWFWLIMHIALICLGAALVVMQYMGILIRPAAG